MQLTRHEFIAELSVKSLSGIRFFDFLGTAEPDQEAHDYCELIYVDSGSIEVTSDNYSGTVKQNQIIVFLADKCRIMYCSEKASPSLIAIDFDCDSEVLGELSKKPFELPPQLKEILADIVMQGRSVFLPPFDSQIPKNMVKREMFPFGADQLVKNLLENFLLYSIRQIRINFKREVSAASVAEQRKTEKLDRVSSVKEYIDLNFTTDISLNELCFLFHTNKTSLCKEFRSAIGTTITDYTNKLRVDFTKRMLRTENPVLPGSRYSLTEISYMLNLSSVHYLTTLFKKHTGMAPTEYLGTIKSKF